MNFKIFIAALIVLILASCSSREIEILDHNGKVIGECSAGFDWHLYGIEDSIDYILYMCAKGHIDKGYAITDPSLLKKDFTLPTPPNDLRWNKKLAMSQYNNDEISEQQLGYILADVEYKYWQVLRSAEDDLAIGKISQREFDKMVKVARFIWLGES